MSAKAAFGLLLLLAAVGGAFAAAPEEAPGCVFPKGSDSQAIETSVRDWARTSGLGAVSKWSVALDGPHAAVELVIDTGTLYEVHPSPRVLDEYAGLLIEELGRRDLIPQH